MDRLSFKNLVPVILWFFLMCVLFFMPGRELPGGGFFEKHHLDKLAHFVLFFILVVLFSKQILKSSLTSDRKLQAIVGFTIFAILFGLLTEFIQDKYIPRRTFDWWDWAADSFGALVALFVMVRLKTAYE